jgi:molybdopterin-biosynthesis enzyme MoeA-like protein
MKVEIVSIGTELLVSDILDTNSAFVSRSGMILRARL